MKQITERATGNRAHRTGSRSRAQQPNIVITTKPMVTKNNHEAGTMVDAMVTGSAHSRRG